MKVRNSGMPAQDYWESLLDVPKILDAFGFDASRGDVAELGCGYGTFTLELAKRIRGTVYAFDIDPEMIAITRRRVASARLQNVQIEKRDVLGEGFGRPAGSCDAVLLFNILHAEDPVALLRSSRHVVRNGGLIAVIHWRSDIDTPRGPELAIRPRAEQIAAWASQADLKCEGDSIMLPPWHFGLMLRRA